MKLKEEYEKDDLRVPNCGHEWSEWSDFCYQHGNGLLIRYCKECGKVRVKPKID